MASIITVAQLAGVGKSTVSRYVNGNGYVSEENQKKIEKAIKQCGYVPSTSGRSLRLNRSYAMAICVPMITHPFFSRFAESLEKAVFEQAGEGNNRLNQVIIVSGEEQKRLKWLMVRHLIDGAFLVTHDDFDPSEYGIPIVTVDRLMGKEVPVVTSGNYESTYAALTYLYDTGARKIGFIGGRPNQRSEVLRRYDAYSDLLKAKNLPGFISYADYRHGQEMEISAQFLAKYKDLDAVFATSDAFGFALYRVSRAMGQNDLRIISYDGCMDDFIQKPVFTCVKQDTDRLARTALDLLLKKIGGKPCPNKVVIPSTFRKGETA